VWEEEVKRRRKAVGGREGLGEKGGWSGKIEAVREGGRKGERSGRKGDGRGERGGGRVDRGEGKRKR